MIDHIQNGLLDIGETCSFCNHIDFLPYTCDLCKLTFCGDHRGTLSHRCSEAPTIQSHFPSKRLSPELSEIISNKLNISNSFDRKASQGRTISEKYKFINSSDLEKQRAEAQIRSQRENEKRLKAIEQSQKTSQAAKQQANAIALDKLKQLLSGPAKTTNTARTPPVAKKGFSLNESTKEQHLNTTQTTTSNPNSRLWSFFGNSGNSSKGRQIKSNPTVSPEKLSELKRIAKPLDPNTRNSSINGSASVVDPNDPKAKRYIVLVVHKSETEPLGSNLFNNNNSQNANESTGQAAQEKEVAKLMVVHTARDILVGRLVDKAIEALRIPKTKRVNVATSSDETKDLTAALFLKDTMIPYSQKLNKVFDGGIQDGDHLVIKYV